MEARTAKQLDAIGEVVALVGDRVIASYLYGSAVLGTLRPNSDIDVFVLLNGPTEHEERRQLVQGLMGISGPHGAVIAGRPVEVTMALVDDLRPWPDVPRREFQYGEWLRGEYAQGLVPEPTIDPDLAAQVSTLLTASAPLSGPAASELLDPVPEAALMDAMLQTVPSLMDELADDTVNVLLTLARISYTAAHGRIVAKDEAAAWALDLLAEETRVPLAYAAKKYVGEADGPPAGFELAAQRTAEELVTQIRQRR